MSIPNLDRLAPPPRRVPLPVLCHQSFGGALNQMGWMLTAFCTPFFWLFFMDCEVISWLKFARPLSTCSGTITRVVEAGGEEGDVRIMAIHYSYALDGRECAGCSYETGTSLSPGNPVTVEYATGNPLVSRIQGLRNRRFGGGALLALIFPAFSIGLLVYGWRRGQRARRVLEFGVPGEALLRSKFKMGIEVDDKPVYKMTFRFTSLDRREFEHSTQTHETEKLEDEPHEQILYDPCDPSFAMLVDDLPVSIRIDDAGGLNPISSRLALLAMLMPIFTIAMNGVWAWKWLS